MKEPHPFPWKAAWSAAAKGQDPLVETGQDWKLENEIWTRISLHIKSQEKLKI